MLATRQVPHRAGLERRPAAFWRQRFEIVVSIHDGLACQIAGTPQDMPATRLLAGYGIDNGIGRIRHAARLCPYAEVFANLVFNFKRHFGIGFEVFADVVAPLANTRVAVAEPRTGFVDHTGLHTQVDDFPFARDAGAVEDIDLSLFEGRRNLVFDHLDTRFVSDDFIAFHDCTNTADIEADGGVKLERISAGGGFRAAKHVADFHADLVNENNRAIGPLDVGGELAQGLAHETGLQ